MRKETADRLKEACLNYCIKYKYSGFVELGLNGNRLKADIVCINFRREILIFEVKSCIQDLRTDNKWLKYADYCNKLYLTFTSDVYEQHKEEILGIKSIHGVAVLESTGYLKLVKPTRRRDMDEKLKNNLIFRMAFRNGVSNFRFRRVKV
jgi:hypothetical protein